MPIRLDFGRMDSPRRTPQGGLRVPAHLTRVGIFSYHRQDGTVVKELRPREEVFHKDALDSLVGAPVTDLHPPEMVSAVNYRKYSAGHVGDKVREDGDLVGADLVIQERNLVGAVERKDRTEVSCGYTCDVEDSPGEYEGQRYDRIQRNIRYNHVAVVPKGRAGSQVSLRLDAEDNVLPPDLGGGGTTPSKPKTQRTDAMNSIRIDGVDYPLETDADKAAAVRAMERYMARTDEESKAAKAEKDTLQGRLDTAEKQVKDLSTEVEGLKDPKRLDAAVEARVALHSEARKVLGSEAKLDGKSDREVMEAAILKADPEAKLDDLSEDYIRGRFEATVKAAPERKDADPDGLHRVRQATGTPAAKPEDRKDEDTAEAAKRRMDEANRTAWQKPLAITKDTPSA